MTTKLTEPVSADRAEVINGRYRLLEPLGQGAQGTVYRVADLFQAGRIKVLKAIHLAADSEAVDRLRWEFVRLARLDHPRLLRVFDLDVAQDASTLQAGQLFFTAEHSAGKIPTAWMPDLGQRRRVALLWRILTDVASALDHIHSKGLVHGDIKPDNLLCTAHGDVKLIDLGLATVADALGAGDVAGTIAHLAPETLAGCPDARADLYALGSTIYTLASGTLARGAGMAKGVPVGDRIRALLEQEPAPLRSLEPTLPEGLCALVDGLLARAPEARPGSARSLLEQIARKRRTVSLALVQEDDGLPLLAVGVVGRDGLIDDVCRVVGARFEPATSPEGLPAVVLLRGGAGSGRSTVLGEVVRRLQLRAAVGELRPLTHAEGATLVQAVRPLMRSAPPPNLDEGGLAELIVGLEEKVADRHTLLVIQQGEEEVAPLSRFFALLRRDPGLRLGRLAVVVRVGRDTALDTGGMALDRTLEPLGRGAVATLLGRALGEVTPEAYVSEVLEASGGLPGIMVELLRAAWAEAGDRRRVTALPVAALMGEGLVGVAAGRLAKLPARERRMALGLGLASRAIPLGWAAELAGLTPVEAWEALELLQHHGVVSLAEGRVSLAHQAYGAALIAAEPETCLALQHQLAGLYAPLAEAGDEEALIAQVGHLAAGPPDPALGALLMTAARKCAGSGKWGQAADLLALGRKGLAPEHRVAGALALAEARVKSGAYDDGLAVLEALGRRLAPEAMLEAAMIRGLALQRRGDLAASREVLREALETAREKGLVRGKVIGGQGQDRTVETEAVLGRVLIGLGELDAATALCAEVAQAPAGLAGVPLLEIGGLARLHRGELEAAGRFFDEAVRRAEAGEDEALLTRALGFTGMLRQLAGALSEAAEYYERACRLAEQRHDLHGAALYAGNLGAVLKDQGRLGEALEPCVLSVRRMMQLGRTGELPAALFNLGNLLLSLGDLSGAIRELTLMAQEADRIGAPLMQGYLLLLGSDVLRRAAAEGRGLPPGLPAVVHDRRPARLAQQAAKVFADLGAAREEAYATLAELESWAAEGRPERAVEASDRLARLLQQLEDPFVSHLAAIARGRLALSGFQDRDAASRLSLAVAFFREASMRELHWRAEVVSAALAEQQGRHDDARRGLQAAGELERAHGEQLPETYQDLRDRDPDAGLMARLEQTLGAAGALASLVPAARQSQTLSREHETAQLRRLHGINKRINSELRLPILLELVLDAVLELTDAERGFILLMNDEDRLEVRIARNMDRQTLAQGEFSHSIAEQAAQRGEAVITVDAALDERFSDAVSVHGLRIRSVLAVPLRVKGRVVGTVYVDNRLRRGAFNDDDLALVQDFSEQAAIAIENARLHEEVRSRTAQIEHLNRELASKVARQEAEIAEMRTEIRQNQEALQVRYDYSNIIGHTPSMTELFHLLDRITDVDLPVVVQGDSGTGKELVARAIHFNGRRKDRPFVSENCGAVPETLLESILFGHVRGAFTGADRDRRGLFEVAHGGTLFLDEVGEMSPAMQTKLLRVLQEGELRRVGGDKTHTVDVRIIAASAQELAALVEAKKFRQDLYYRLNVLQVKLPLLRERSQDVPLLVRHFIGKYSPDRTRRVARAALDRLMAYHWPGNVRELENEIQRALALGGDLLSLEDLSPAVRGGGSSGQPVPDDLDLRAHVEHLERDLLRKALERTGSNQTQAAKLLGLSRFGLLKKLKRYGMLHRVANSG